MVIENNISMKVGTILGQVRIIYSNIMGENRVSRYIILSVIRQQKNRMTKLLVID